MHVAKKYISKSLSIILSTAVLTLIAVTTMYISENQSSFLYRYLEHPIDMGKTDFKAYKPNDRSFYTNNSIHAEFELIDRNYLNTAVFSDNYSNEYEIDNAQYYNQYINTNNFTKSYISSNNAVNSIIGMEAYALVTNKQASNSYQSIGGSNIKLTSSSYKPFEDAGPQKNPNNDPWGDLVDPGDDPVGQPLPVGNGLLIFLFLAMGYIMYISRFKISANS